MTVPEQQLAHHDAPILKVDFTWKKWKILISEESNDKTIPSMIVSCHSFHSPNLVFKSAIDDSTIGTSDMHAVSIHPDYEIRGQKGQLRALKKLKTKYTHLSLNYGTKDKPMAMTWTTSSTFTDWDFICLDENQEPVARFNSSWWAVKKLGNIEFLGPKANDPAAREEIVVVGLSLWYCMILRMNNIFNFFGAIFGSTGPIEQEKQPKITEHASATQMDDLNKGKVD